MRVENCLCFSLIAVLNIVCPLSVFQQPQGWWWARKVHFFHDNLDPPLSQVLVISIHHHFIQSLKVINELFHCYFNVWPTVHPSMNSPDSNPGFWRTTSWPAFRYTSCGVLEKHSHNFSWRSHYHTLNIYPWFVSYPEQRPCWRPWRRRLRWQTGWQWPPRVGTCWRAWWELTRETVCVCVCRCASWEPWAREV